MLLLHCFMRKSFGKYYLGDNAHSKYRQLDSVNTFLNLIRKQQKNTGTDACVHMGLKMCTNCGQIHRHKKHQSIPKHARVRKHTERCDVPGRAVKSCYLRKHLAKQTKASQGKCLFHHPEQHYQHLRGEGAENGLGAIGWIHTRYDEREDDREIMEAWGWGGRTNWRVEGVGGAKSSRTEIEQKARSKSIKRWLDGRTENCRCSIEELSVRITEECKEFSTV